MVRGITVVIFSFYVLNVHAGLLELPQQESDFNGLYAKLNARTLPDTHLQWGGNAHAKLSDNTNLFDGHVGYGKYFNQNMYVGAKTSVYHTALDHALTAPFSATTSATHQNAYATEPVYNIDAVFGYETYPHLLPFLEAGVSIANLERKGVMSTASNARLLAKNSLYANLLNANQYTAGYNVGVGANYQLKKNWFLSSELIYNYLGKDAAGPAKVPTSSVMTATDSKLKSNQAISLLASVSYLFPTS